MIYCYKCLECGKQFEEVLSMSESDKKISCECGGNTVRDFQTEVSGGVIDSQHREYDFEGSNGTRMYAAAYLPHQKEEMLKNHPGRDFKLRNGCYLPVIKDRMDKKQFLKERGFIEYT
jgi:putative FmdB family regulatory protein